MNHRQRYLRNSEVGIDNRTPEEVITNLVNILIRHLYIPKLGFEGIDVLDDNRLEAFEVEREFINWADVGCIEVKESTDGTYIAVVSEAGEDQCPTFCDYIERYMKSWGWNVRVETEW